MNTILDIDTFSLLREASTDFFRQGSDFTYVRLTDGSLLEKIPQHDEPMRVEGMAWLICLSGTMDVEVNLVRHTLERGSLLILMPGTILEIISIDREGLDCYSLLLSPGFIESINVDINVISRMPRRNLGRYADPVIRMSAEETEVIGEMCRLLCRNSEVNGSTVYSQAISRSIIAAMIYQGTQIVSERLSRDEKEKDTGGKTSRRSNYVHEFMKLVRSNFMNERSVSYYASRLCITPKYLSLLIKEHTGRTAGEVIDNFVILEAKNLLRFSGKNI
ncbi:MAG: hypothetical protein K2K55_09925, partial [Duncaniella sp.]|nr:hypothetical protein [Duncaniella sp.]